MRHPHHILFLVLALLPCTMRAQSSKTFANGILVQIANALDSIGFDGQISIDTAFQCVSRRQGNDGPPFEQNPILTPAKSADATLPIFPLVPALQSEFYYYHYNHQGSVAVVSDMTGRMQQHLHYLPYGGLFVDQHRSSSTTPSRYTFSAKEKDSETGYTYFGARYYSDNIMMWLSVDPMSDKYPSMSPYMYCAGNPIKFVDPNGDTIRFVNEKAKVYVNRLTDKESSDYCKVFTIKYNRLERSKTIYNIEHVSGANIEGKAGGVYNGENGSVDIKFTSNFGARTTDVGGFSPEYAALFEEIYHAVDIDKGRFTIGTQTAMDEARAWKFATKAKGTTLRLHNGDYTVAHTINTFSYKEVAMSFIHGMKDWQDDSGFNHYMIRSKDNISGLYHYLPYK